MPVEKLGTWTYESGGTTTAPAITISGSIGGSTLTFLAGKDDDLDFAVAPLHLAVIDSTANGSAIRHRIFATDTLRETSFHTTPTKTKTDTTYFTYIGGVCFNNDGTKLIMGGIKTDATYKVSSFPVSTPWSATSVGTSPNGEYSLPSSAGVRSLCINPAGNKLYLLDGTGTGRIREYSMSTAFDVTTLSETGGIQFVNTTALGIDFNPDGTKLYAARSDGVLEQHTLTVGWDFTTASLSLDGSAPSGYPDLDSVAISKDGRTLLVGYSARIWEYQIYEPYNILTYLNILGQVPHTGNYTYVDIFNSDAYDICINKEDSTKFYSVSDIDDINGFTAPTGLTGDTTYTFGDDSEEYCILVYEFSGTSVAHISDVASATGINSNSGAPINITASDDEALVNGVLIDGDSTPIVINSSSWQGQVHTHLQSTIGGSGSVGLSGIYRTTAETLGCQFGFASSDDYIYFVLKLNALSTGVTHDGAANLSSVCSLAAIGTIETDPRGKAALVAVTSLSADGTLIYAATDAVELTAFRFQSVFDVEGGTPTWLETIDNGVTISQGDSGWLQYTHAFDQSFRNTYYKPVRLRFLVKNTSALTITDWQPKLSSKIITHGETEYIDNRDRLWCPYSTPGFNVDSGLSTDVDTWSLDSSIAVVNLSSADNPYVLIKDHVNGILLLLEKNIASGNHEIKKYNSTTGAWDIISSTVLDGFAQFIQSARCPVYGRIVSDPEYFGNYTTYWQTTDGTSVTAVSGAPSASPVDACFLRNSKGFFLFRGNSFYDTSDWSNSRAFTYSYTGTYNTFSPNPHITLQGREVFVSSEGGFGSSQLYLQAWDFTTETASASANYHTVEKIPFDCCKNTDDTIAYFIYINRVDSAGDGDDVTDLTVIEYNSITKLYSSYSLTQQSAAVFYSDKVYEDERIISGLVGNKDHSYMVDPASRLDGYISRLGDYSLIQSNEINTDKPRPKSPTLIPHASTLTSTDWPSGVLIPADTTYLVGENYSVCEFPYTNKDNFYTTISWVSGLTSASDGIVKRKTTVSPSQNLNRTATQQALGAGTFQASNTAVLNYGLSKTPMVSSFLPNEELEITVDILVDKNYFDKLVDESAHTIYYHLLDDRGVLKESANQPFIELRQPITHSAEALLETVCTFTPTPPTALNAIVIISLLATPSVVRATATKLNVLSKLIADWLPEAAFQTVLTQFFNEDGTEISTPMIGAPNLHLDIDINTPSAQNYFWTTTDYDITLKARWLVRNTTGASILFNPLLQVRKNGGTWKDLQTINPGDASGFTEHTYFSCYRGLPDGPATAHLSGSLAIGDSAWSSLLHPHKVLDYLLGDKILVWFGKQGNGTGNFLPDYTVCRWDATTGNVTTLQTAVMYEATVNLPATSGIGDTGICSMANGDMYFLQIGNNSTEATMMKYNGTTWAEITGHGWPTNAAGAYLNKIELFEDSGTLYAIGGYVVTVDISSIGVYSFNGTTWSLEAHDGYVPAGGVKYLHTLVHDKVAGVLYYLLRNSANPGSYSVDKVSYNISTKTFSAPVVAFSAGTITASLASLAFVMGEPSPHNTNLYYTFSGYQNIGGFNYGKLFEFNKATNTWAIHGYEAVYIGTGIYNAFTFWNGALDKLVVVGVNGTTRMFNYDSVANTYHTNLGYGTPMNVYIDGAYRSTEPFILNPSGTDEPIYYIEYGSADYNFTADGYYIYGYSQDLDNVDQHWTDTTKQLPSTNAYTYLAANKSNITRTPYIEAQLTIANNEEVELAYSLQINKTQLDIADADAVLEYRLFNQNTTYPINDRLHYPTINYIKKEILTAIAQLDTITSLSGNATVSQATDVLGYAQLNTIASLSAIGTKTTGFIQGQADLQIIISNKFDATHYIGSYWHWPVRTHVLAVATVNQSAASDLKAISEVNAFGRNEITATSDKAIISAFDALGSFVVDATSGLSTLTDLTGTSVFDIQSPVSLTAICNVTADYEIILSSIPISLHARTKFSANDSQFIFSGSSTFNLNFNIFAAPKIIRPASVSLASEISLVSGSVRFATTDVVFNANTFLTFDSFVEVSAATEITTETTLGGSLVWDDNRDIIKFSCYINQVEEFDIPGGVHYTDQFITTYQKFDMNIISDIAYNLVIEQNRVIQTDICSTVIKSLDLTKEDPYLIDAYINMINAIDLGIMQSIKLNTDIKTTVLYDMHIKQSSEYNIKLGY